VADTHHETSDVNVRALWWLGVAFVASGIVLHLAVWIVFVLLQRREAEQAVRPNPLVVEQESRLPPEPRLQPAPHADLAMFRAQEDSVLKSYAWVDRNAGVVRIPIERAMQLTAERGLPARQGGR
jgi:hypothetical protein